MKFKEEMAAKWRAEADALEKRAAYWETGELRAYMNDIDVTADQAPMLRRHAAAVREALAMLEADG